MAFRVVPIEGRIVDEVRTTLRAPGYGHPATVEVAAGYGPCRSCLQPFEQGAEERILFTHDSFAGREPYPLPGPVFVHREECEPFAEADVFPHRLRFIRLTLNAYARERILRRQVRLGSGADAEAVLERLFDDPDVAYVHVHNTDAGCFIAAVERAPSSVAAP